MNSENPSSLALFCKEPYRLFFPIGLFWALVATSHWISFHFQFTRDYGPVYHGFMQIIGFGGCFSAGFLMTALPNFLGTKPADPWELFVALALGIAGGVFLLMNKLGYGIAAFGTLLVHIDIFTARRFAKSQGGPPPFTYLVCGLAMGTLACVLIWFPIPHMMRLGERMLEQGMLISFIMGIGSFLGARMLGTFQPPGFLFRQKPGRPPVPPFVKMQRLFMLGGFLLFTSFWLECLTPLAGQLLRAAAVTSQFFLFARIYRRPTMPSFPVWALWTSMWLLVAGLWLAALMPQRYEIGALHVAFIGGIGLMILVMSMRVVASHGGVMALWENARISPTILIACTALAAILRLGAMFMPKFYTHHLAAGAAVWDIALITWAFIALPKLTPSHRE